MIGEMNSAQLKRRKETNSVKLHRWSGGAMLARMPLFVNRIRRCLLALALGFAVVPSTPSWASDQATASMKRWAPAFAVQGGVIAQTASGMLSGSDIYGACWLGAGVPVPRGGPGECMWGETGSIDNQYLTRQQAPTSDTSRMMTPYFSLAAELMSPALLSGWGSPRALAHADIGYAFGFARGITRVGSPLDRMELPFPPSELDTHQPPLYNSEQEMVGQGSKLTASVDSLLVGAGFGIAFTFEVGDRTFRVKPTVEYLREEMEISGTLRQATRTTFFSPPRDMSQWTPTTPIFGAPLNIPEDATPADAGFREINLDGSSTRVYHGVGPGLELEMDTGRVGPFVVSIYSGMRAYHFSGDDLSVDFVAQNPPDTAFTLDGLPPGPGTNVEGRNENLFRNCSVDNANQCESASFSFEKESWAYTGHVGLRFRFSPE